jgi:hypothetical protein
VQSIRQQREAERARVKKAIAEMKRKMDGCVPAPPLLLQLCCNDGVLMQPLRYRGTTSNGCWLLFLVFGLQAAAREAGGRGGSR